MSIPALGSGRGLPIVHKILCGLQNLELRDVIPTPEDSSGNPVPSKYNLVANICHDGKPGDGTYKSHIHRKSEEMWYEVQDLSVADILPQQVVLTEAFIQVYELQKT
ncbi:hypothetical protein CYMTET_23159 [Cymbomonas tetramitiformis]|uniref:USP domain-containing protein n=1 Tax=Cymbomonas tetramitiformis TaxID=36881 RepID=A0AAE0FZ14_9CHLO|nr:hypothetical protein CYMTET_23159 [Cymbomonas tetramitiformis]